jgi:hypothetical protein
LYNILGRGLQNLEELELLRNVDKMNMRYMRDLDLALAKLRSVKLQGLELPAAFGGDLLRLPSLECVHLKNCRPVAPVAPVGEEAVYEGWQAVFEAIRQHTNDIHLKLDHCYHLCDGKSRSGI